MTTIKLYGMTTTDPLVATVDLISELADRRPILRYRNKLYGYVRHGFDGTIHYHELPEPFPVDDIAQEMI